MSSLSTKSRLGLCAIIGVALAAIPGCSAGANSAASARAQDGPALRPAGTRMMASDSVGGMVFGQPERRQGDTTFANAPTE